MTFFSFNHCSSLSDLVLVTELVIGVILLVINDVDTNTDMALPSSTTRNCHQHQNYQNTNWLK